MSQFFKSATKTSNIYSITDYPESGMSVMPQVDEARILMEWAHQIFNKALNGTVKLLELYQFRSVLNEEASVRALQKVHKNLLPGYLSNIDKAINHLIDKQQYSTAQPVQPAIRVAP